MANLIILFTNVLKPQVLVLSFRISAVPRVALPAMLTKSSAGVKKTFYLCLFSHVHLAVDEAIITVS